MRLQHPLVDLRSDTVTRPTAGMRRAIAEAEVGDDVFGDDPTVRALEARVAEQVGKPAALFVPSGTMGNQLAVHCLARAGDEVMLEAESHIFLYEQGGIAANSGALAHVVTGARGMIAPAQLSAAIRGVDDHNARLSVLCVENTHNRHGGTIVPLEHLRALSTLAHAHEVKVHLDGARLWNASVATGIPVRAWAETADTLMMCFSKGLGAPVGSILTGPADLIREARRVRKRWGGGMRQVGILAAACLYALDHHFERLAEDHARARRLADGIARAPGVNVSAPETNILYVTLEHPALDPMELIEALARRGVRVSRYGPRLLRAITHLDIGDDSIQHAIEAFQTEVEARAGSHRGA